MIALGSIVDGRALSYDATLYEFRLDRAVITYQDLKQLDDHAHVRWLAPEQRDWFKRINPADLDRCNRKALSRHGMGYEALSPEEQVLFDAKRNDSILAGKIVDADPALVQAVAQALEEKGLVGQGGGYAQPVIGMPQGMEALSQLQKQEGRKMTMMEHFLMRQILKNDDKEKLKREKEAASLEAAAEKQEAKDAKEMKKRGKINQGQKRMEKREAQVEKQLRKRSASMQVEKAAPQQGVSYEAAMAAVEQSSALRASHAAGGHHGAPHAASVQYYDSYGNPIVPEPDAMRPSMSQNVINYQSEEEKALIEMRERNLAAQSQVQGSAESYVPGMDRKRRRNRNEGASINGRQVNADGSPKETKFDKFLGNAGKVIDVVSPLVGGGRRGGGGGGGMGGGGGAGMGGGMGGGMGRGM